MLEISTAKVVRVIFLGREFGPDSDQLKDYISGLNDDEKANLVALHWVGRETYDAAEFEEAKQTALIEATAPTERYLSGVPDLSECLEDGLDKLGIDVTDVEDHM